MKLTEFQMRGILLLRYMRKEYKNLMINETPQIKEEKRKFFLYTGTANYQKYSAILSVLTEILEKSRVEIHQKCVDNLNT